MSSDEYPVIVQERVDAINEVRAAATSCPYKESGCFGADPEAYVEMLYVDDSLRRANIHRAAIAASKVGEEALASGESPEVDAIVFTQRGYDGEGEVEATLGDYPDSLLRAAATCAYRCALNGDSCPIPRDKS